VSAAVSAGNVLPRQRAGRFRRGRGGCGRRGGVGPAGGEVVGAAGLGLGGDALAGKPFRRSLGLAAGRGDDGPEPVRRGLRAEIVDRDRRGAVDYGGRGAVGPGAGEGAEIRVERGRRGERAEVEKPGKRLLDIEGDLAPAGTGDVDAVT